MKNSCLKNLKMSVLHPMSDQLSINHRFKANRLKDNCEKSKTFEMICFMRKKSNSRPCCLAELLMKKEKGQNSFFLSMCTKIAQEVSSLSSVDHPSTLLFFFFWVSRYGTGEKHKTFSRMNRKKRLFWEKVFHSAKRKLK